MNDRYYLIGGIVYNTPVDDTNHRIDSPHFERAIGIADFLLLPHRNINAILMIIKGLDREIIDYMNSPLIDFLYTNGNAKTSWICLACRTKHVSILRYIIEHLSLRTSGHDQITGGLPWAANNGQLDIIRYLIKCGAKINTEYGTNAITYAAENGHLDIVRFLVECGAAIDPIAMRWACSNGHIDVVHYLRERGISINIAPTILSNSARKGHFSMVKYLIENGIDRTYVSYARLLAMMNNQVEIDLYLQFCS